MPVKPALTAVLSERELDILRLIADGWANRQIAEHLFLSLETIKWYNKRIYSTLEVKNRTEAVKMARERGLLESTSLETQPLRDTPPPHRLPAATTPFVGRQIELGELANLLADENARLITILAAGGMGKTRLALEVAKSQTSHFQDGVFYVPLTQVRTVDDIPPTIATSLNVQLSTASDPTHQLQTYLCNKAALLILDNFEHVVDGSDHVTMLLNAAPNLKIVATSRERLNLSGEIVYALGGMALPTENTRAETLNCSAVRLFIQGMQRIQPNMAIADKDLPFVRDICLRVGGMPLGIQLAASLVDVLSLQDIAREIERNIDILATDMRDVPLRLRSIRAVFDYSWSRLSQAEREVYMRLSVFRAGFTREASQAVAGSNVIVLKALVNKSLLQWEPDAERYTMHELLRQYAEEQLQASARSDTVYQAHRSFYLDLMARCEIGIKGQHQLEALNQIEADFDNIRFAWGRAVEQNDPDAINRTLEPLYWFCRMRARVPVGEILLQQARNQWDVSFALESHPVQRRLLLRFDKTGAPYRAALERMLTVVRAHGTPQEIAFFLWILGMNRYLSSDFKQAVVILEEAVARVQALHDDFYRAELLHWLSASKRFLGQVDEVNAHARKVREICRRTGNTFALARILGRQGVYAVLEDDTVQARNDLHEAIALREALGDRAGIAKSLAGLSLDAFFQGDFSRAHALAEESWTLATESNSLFPKAFSLSVLGWLAAVEEAYDKAWDLCHESLAVLSDPNVAFMAQFGLAMAACGLEQYAVARAKVDDFLNSSSPFHTTKGYLSFLPVLAILCASQNEAGRAVEVLALAFTHPNSPTRWMEKWMLLNRWRKKLEALLGVEQYEIAWECGTKLELESIMP